MKSWNFQFALLLGSCLLGVVGTTLPLARADFVGANATFNDDAVIVRVDEGIRRVRLRALNAESGVWELVQMSHLKGDAGYIKIRVPDGLTSDDLKVEVSATDPFPYSFYAGKTSFGQKTEIDGSVSGGNRNAPPNAEADGALDAGGGVEVAESDIWRIRGDRLYFFNQLRGLQLFDLKGDPEPEKIASLRMPAVGEQMYVLDDRYTILLAAWASWNRSEIVLTEYDEAAGLRESHRIALPGSIAETRLIGDLLYVVTRFSEYIRTEVPAEEEVPRGEEGEDAGTVERWVYKTGLDLTVIDYSDPSAPKELEGLQLAEQDRWGFYNAQVAATPTHLLVSTSNYENRKTTSEVYVIDIADQSKAPALVAQVPVDGHISDKFKMRIKADLLTTVSQINDWGNRRFETVVETFEIGEAHKGGFNRLDQARLGLGEQLFATRFHQDRLYVVTFERIDPFWVIDLADPRDLRILGELEVPGFSRYLEPRGDDILAIGVENRVVTASLFNATDPTNPTLLSRVSMGEGYSWSEGNYDEKAINFNAEEGLLLVPYQSYHNGKSEQKVQIIDVSEKAMTKRGTIDHNFRPRRAGLWNDHIVSVSGRELLVVDATDRDNPTTVSNTVIAWSTDRVIESGGYLLQVEEGNYWDSNATNALRVTTTGEPDTVLSEISLGEGTIVGMEERDGSLHLICSIVNYITDTNEDGQQVTRTEQMLQASVVDISDPGAVRLLGQTELTTDDDSPYYYGTSELKALWLPGGELAWATNGNGNSYCRWCWGDIAFDGDVADIAFPFYYQPQVEVHVVDVSDKTAPAFLSSSVVSSENSWSYSEAFLIGDDQVGVSYQTNTWLENEKRYLDEHSLRIVDLENPRVPLLVDEISISGRLSSVVTTQGGGTVFITEGQQSAKGETPSDRWWSDAYLQASIFDGVTTFLLDEVKIENGGYATSVYSGPANYRQVSPQGNRYELLGRVWDESTGTFASSEPVVLEQWLSDLAVHDDILFGSYWPSTLIGIDVSNPLVPGNSESFPLGSNLWIRADRMQVDRAAGAWLPTGAYGVAYVDFAGAFEQSNAGEARVARDEDDAEEWVEVARTTVLVVAASGNDFVGDLTNVEWRYVPDPKQMSYGEWAVLHFNTEELTDPNLSGVSADADGDGVGNGLEFLYGSDPRMAASSGKISMSKDGDKVTASFPVSPLATWEVQRSTNLEKWELFPDATIRYDGVMGRIDLDASTGSDFIRFIVND
jgi:hypothetical protein